MNFSKWANILKLILLKIVEEIERRINEKNGVDTSDTFSHSLYTSLKFIILEQVDGLVDEVVSYSKSQVNTLSDMIAQKMSIIIASLVYVLMLLALVFLVFIFFTVSLALYLGDVLGQTYYGFLITGSTILFITLIIFFVGHKSIASSIKNQIMRLV